MSQNLLILINLIPLLLKGAVVSVEVATSSLVIGLFIGLFVGLGRIYGSKVISWFAILYITVIRATPPIVSLFVLYFVISRYVNLPPLLAGILALGISSGAYQSEIMRSAIESVGQSQMLAARAVGMSRIQAITNIILPQAFRLAIPPWSNEAAQMLKNSSLVYALSIPEILRQAQYVSATTLKPFLAFGAAAVIYFILNFGINRGLDSLEKKVKIPAQESVYSISKSRTSLVS